MNRVDLLPERHRRAIANALQWGGWLGGLGLLIWNALAFNPNKGHFAPPWLGLTFIFLIGIAIAATSARARMRLGDAITGAFQAGMNAMAAQIQAAKEEAEERDGHNHR